ncbi:hypothetical protein M9Y10_041181 [Tritrichomonas musculus]|uniref:Uncharacterized protein n=1 Tax=Tritrichomonas musculus TaxID=1915356 RepID=A0ABR2K3V7_9EUKA
MVQKRTLPPIKVIPETPFGDMTKRTFLPFYEEILASFIEGSFLDGVQMDILLHQDEISVDINDGGNTTIVPTGTDEIAISSEKNTKECFIAIRTFSRSKKYDLIVLGDTTTHQYCSKFGAQAETWPSLGGLMN